MTDQTPIDRRSLTTAQRLAEYVSEMRSKGIPVCRATVDGRKIILDLQDGVSESINPADLVDP